MNILIIIVIANIINSVEMNTLRRQKRDQISWNRTRNTLSSVSRRRSKPTNKPVSYREQLEQHYRENPHQRRARRVPENSKNEAAEQFLIGFFY